MKNEDIEKCKHCGLNYVKKGEPCGNCKSALMWRQVLDRRR